jgi:putative acetyltransferase
MTMEIRLGGLDEPQVRELLEIHVRRARAETAPGSAHALDLEHLRGAEIEFWTIWEDGRLLGMGALKRVADDHYEIKSMHTAQAVRRRGIGNAMLRHLMEMARQHGARRLSLETGAEAYFLPAAALYRKHGFAECEPFADYVVDPNSVFMTHKLGD